MGPDVAEHTKIENGILIGLFSTYIKTVDLSKTMAILQISWEKGFPDG